MSVSVDDINLFISILKNISEYDFSEYSSKSFTRRIEKILIDYKLDLEGLISKVKKDKEFMEQVIKDITVNTTELFRDPKTWQTLKYRVLPKFEEKSSIYIWHAGSSTGQEVYSMIILLNELNLLHKAKIYATDINSDVINVAKEGKYVYRFNIDYLENFDQVIKQNPFNFEEYKDVPYSKYFIIDKVKDTIAMSPSLTNKAIYKKHDLVKQGNIFDIKFDIILCRNVLIYFNYELQNRLFGMFHESLNNNGYLVLGIHESILGPQSQKFNKKGLVYSKKLI
jgi:chemotaxis protein methyltransferase CheR